MAQTRLAVAQGRQQISQAGELAALAGCGQWKSSCPWAGFSYSESPCSPSSQNHSSVPRPFGQCKCRLTSVIPQKSLSARDSSPGLREKAGKASYQACREAGQGPFPEYPGPSVREQASYLCVFREENSSEMICFKKLKQKKKI